jgi:hypothetical protein
MDIRDLGTLERAATLIDELLECCKKGGAVGNRCPHLAADAHRKANALKASLERLRRSLDEAGPPHRFLRERPPLYLRLNDHKELREIARLIGHHGCPEAELRATMKRLQEEVGVQRVTDAVLELTWVSDHGVKWVKLRPEVIRACRPMIGPPPDAEDYDQWWRDKGGPPRPRSPKDSPAKEETPAPEQKLAVRKKAAATPPGSKPQGRKPRKKTGKKG